MNYHPILFSTPMMKANLAGKKTMTRRIIRGLPDCGFVDLEINPEVCFEGDTDRVKTLKGLYATFESYSDSIETFPMRKSKYMVGDILWVRETWQHAYDLDDNDQIIEGTGKFIYAASPDNFPHWDYWLDHNTGEHKGRMPWRPSIFMPKEACRLFLRVTDVRVERVQDISPQDAHKEGIEFRPFNGDYQHYQDWLIKDFKELWDSINFNRGYGWEKNPWVWVYTYERVDKPEGWCA